MTYSFKIFSDQTTIPSPSSIHIADGSNMNVRHKGSISSSDLSLPNTFLIPSLNINLIFVGQLCDLGYDEFFSSHGCRVQDLQTGHIIGKVHKGAYV